MPKDLAPAFCPRRQGYRRLLGHGLGLACLLGAFLAWPQGLAAKSLLAGEEVLDADGYLALRPERDFDEAKLVARFGPAQWEDEEDYGEGQGRTKWLWEEGPNPDGEDGESSPRALTVEAYWRGSRPKEVAFVEVGAQFSLRPLVGGLPLTEGAAIRAKLPGAIEADGMLKAAIQGLSLLPWAPGRGQGFRLVNLHAADWAPLQANTQKAHEALLAWRSAQSGWGQLLMGRLFGVSSLEAKGSVLVPTTLHRIRKVGTHHMLSLRLPAHSLNFDGDNSIGPSAEVRLEDGPTALALRPGDVVLTRGMAVRLEGAAGPEAKLLVALLRPIAAYPGGQRFPYPELWHGPAAPGP